MIDDGFTVRLGITKLEVISALKDAVNFKEISEESAIQIAKRHIPEELDNLFSFGTDETFCETALLKS